MYTAKRAMRLAHDVPNPKFDRRRRYGDGAIETFKAGTFLVSYTKADGEPFVELLGLGTFSYGMGHLLVKYAEPSDPRTAAEAMLLADIAVNCADNLLQQMVDMGLVSLSDIGTAGEALKVKWNAEG